MNNLPDGCNQNALDRHLDGDERPCPDCGELDGHAGDCDSVPCGECGLIEHAEDCAEAICPDCGGLRWQCTYDECSRKRLEAQEYHDDMLPHHEDGL